MSIPSISGLRARIAELSARYLDPQIASELDSAFEIQIDDIAAFRLLAHAEIEAFMEAVAIDRLKRLRKLVAAKNALEKFPWIYPIAAIVGKEIAFDCPLDARRLESSLLSVIDEAEKVVSANNGVKSASLLKLSVFCGFFVDQIDSTLAADLSAFGKERGDVAHSSARRVRSINSPSTEKANVERLLNALDLHLKPLTARSARSRGCGFSLRGRRYKAYNV